MWSPIKFDFLFYDFFLFTMIFQRFIQNKHKTKLGKPLENPPREVICPVSRVRGGKLSGFRV